MNVKSEELNLLSDATECRNVDLDQDKALTNINFVKNMKNLVSVNLYNTGIQTIGDALDHVKDQLEELNLGNTKVSFDEKAKFLKDEVTVQEGTTSSKGFISHLFDYDKEEVFLTDDAGSALTAKSDWRTINISAEKGSAGKTGELTIKDGEKSKKIKIKIIGKDQNAPGFAQNKIDDTIGHFIEIKTKDGANIDMDNDISVDNEDVVKVDSIFKEGPEEKDIYYLEPQGVGTAKVTAKFTKDGVTYTDTMEVNISKAKDNIVPLKSVDTNGDGQIDEKEIKNVKQMNLYEATRKELKLLEAAENCTDLDLSYNSSVRNLDFIDCMKNLQELDLRGINKIKDYSKLRTIKNQLIYLNLSDSNIDDEERLSYVYTNEISIGAGNEITNPILPMGIINDTDTYAIENSNVAEVVDRWTYDKDGYKDQRIVTIKGKKGQEGKETNLVITTDEGETLKIPVKVTQGSIVNPPVVAPAEPTKPENPKPEAPKPTPTQPTTAAPQKVAKITVTAPSNKLSAGKKVKLTANISNDASNKNIKWTTSNKKYATVDKNGVVKFNKKAAGKTVTITAYATDGSGKKATFKIKIMKGTVKKIKITGKKTVKAGKTLSLKAKVTASKGANKKLKWTSSNTKYATVSGSGKVKALKAGKKKSVKITAMATDGSGKKATVTIKIK